MKHITFSIDDSTGEMSFLVNEDTRAFLDDTSIVRRASHVEPRNLFLRVLFYTLRGICGEYGRIEEFTRTWVCVWRVNLAPVNGPILPAVYYNRQCAIDAEIEWLEAHFL